MEKLTGTWTAKKGLAQMLKGGVIMDVVTPEHARIAEEAGACAVMALCWPPANLNAIFTPTSIIAQRHPPTDLRPGLPGYDCRN